MLVFWSRNGKRHNGLSATDHAKRMNSYMGLNLSLGVEEKVRRVRKS
jgi:hypothetical protein